MAKRTTTPRAGDSKPAAGDLPRRTRAMNASWPTNQHVWLDGGEVTYCSFFDFAASKRPCLMTKRSSAKPAANARITINRIVSTPMPHAPPTCSNCDIRTGKSPSNVIGQKHLPSVTKIPQGRLSNRSQSDTSRKTGEPRCSRWPGVPVAAPLLPFVEGVSFPGGAT